MIEEERRKAAQLLVEMYGEYMRNLEDVDIYAEVETLYSEAVAVACMALGALGQEATT